VLAETSLPPHFGFFDRVSWVRGVVDELDRNIQRGHHLLDEDTDDYDDDTNGFEYY
jgi:hypothetical protein